MNEKMQVTVKGVSGQEIEAAMDALELLIEHSDVDWVKKFLAEHDIEVK